MSQNLSSAVVMIATLRVNHLLITFSKSLDPDLDQQKNVSPGSLSGSQPLDSLIES